MELNGESLLSACSEISLKTDHSGIIHQGFVYFIQNKFGDNFVPKAAIYSVLKNTPSHFPLDLSEQIKRDDFEATDKMNAAFKILNKGLLFGVGGSDIAEIIDYAKEYVELNISSNLEK